MPADTAQEKVVGQLLENFLIKVSVKNIINLRFQ